MRATIFTLAVTNFAVVGLLSCRDGSGASAAPTTFDSGNAAIETSEASNRPKMLGVGFDSAANAVPAAGSGDNIVTADTPVVTSEYTLSLEVPRELKVGKKNAFHVVLTPAKGWKLNREFPTKLEIAAPAGVSVAKPVQKVADATQFEEKVGAKWSFAFTPTAAGEKSFTGLFRFAVCTDATCNPKKADLSFSVLASAK